MADAKDEQHEAHKAEEKPKARRRNFLKWLVFAGGALVGVTALATGYVFSVSPGPIRSPKMDHFHFRLQIIVDGKAVDFSGQPFQTAYAKDQCSADLPTEPFHFHDQKDQFVHVHWAGMTGGLALKNYGWNFVGGKSNILGYRMDGLPRVKAVPIHGNSLPALPNDVLWVYTGDEHGYQKRSFEDFKNQDLETFFGVASNFPKTVQAGGVMDRLFPRAFAHGAALSAGADETDAERLTRINNLLGNVVIFVQKYEPSDAQVKARFADLEPLSDSTCGG